MTARTPTQPARSSTAKIRPTPKLANSQAASPIPTSAPTRAPSRKCARRLDSEDVRLLPVAIDVRRKRGVLVGKVACPVIARARQVVGDIQNSPWRVGQVRLRSMGYIAIEEDDIPGCSRYRFQAQPLLFERLPLLADEALTMPAGSHLQAAVFQRGRVQSHHGGDE